ncbi:MAG: ABC transporter permease [Candidatus Solibacter sp.]
MNRYQVRHQSNTWRHKYDLVCVLVARDFKLRYKRSILGIAWSLLVPLAQLVVLYVVFSGMVPLNIPHYTTFLFTGILPWTWLQASLLVSAMTVVDNRDLVKQVGFPLPLLPVVTVLSHLVHFLLALPILAVFLVNDGYRPNASLAALPLIILVQFLFVSSLAYIVATLQVRFRDTQYLLGIALFLFFYLTPVFWDVNAVPEPYHSIMLMNPVAMILDGYRAVLMRGVWPEPFPLLGVAGLSVIVLTLACTAFNLVRHRFVEEL